MGTGVGERTPDTTRRGVGHARIRRAPIRSRTSWPTWLALGLTLLFLVTTALVASGATQAFDTRAVHELRPGDMWGPSQLRWAPWMSRLRPQHMYIALGATSLLMTAWRRSVWPIAFGALLAGTSGVLTVLVKLVFERPDPHGFVTPTGGSYPSGHVIAVIVCLGGCLLVVWPRVPWWLWAPVVTAAGLMTASLLTAAAHWPTDVLGGDLLALALVSGSSQLRLRRRACESRSAPSPLAPP